MPKAEVRAQKEQTVTDLADKIRRSQLVIVTDYRGLSVSEMSGLRGRLRQAGAEYQVAKNTLTRFAAQQAGRAGRRLDRTIGDRVRVRRSVCPREVAPGVPAGVSNDHADGQGWHPRGSPRDG